MFNSEAVANLTSHWINLIGIINAANGFAGSGCVLDLRREIFSVQNGCDLELWQNCNKENAKNE